MILSLRRCGLVLCLFAPLARADETAKKTAEGEIHYQADVVYGRVDGSGLLADIAYPSGKGPFPGILSVHGGRWVAGSKTDGSAIKVKEWAGLGFFAMSIDYRLAGSSPAPACYQDVLCAIRWLHAHAKQYSIDPNRVYLIGQSAGGHMVSLAGTMGEGTYKRTGGWNDQPIAFRAVISVCAPYELNSLDWGKLWTPIGADAQAARQAASPIRYVKAEIKPILIIHSDDDRSVPIQQAVDMAQALEKAGAKHRFLHYKDKGHMGIADYVIRESLTFIREVEAAK